MSVNREMNFPPSQFNLWAGEGKLSEVQKYPNQSHPSSLCKKEPVKKEWIKIFPVEFRSNFLPTAAAAGLRWNVDDGELQSAPCSSCCFPDPRGFLREPQFPEGARTASSETSIHGPAVNLLWLSWGFLFCSSACVLPLGGIIIPDLYIDSTSLHCVDFSSTVFEFLDHFPVRPWIFTALAGSRGARLLACSAAAQFAVFTADSKQWSLTPPRSRPEDFQDCILAKKLTASFNITSVTKSSRQRCFAYEWGDIGTC